MKFRLCLLVVCGCLALQAQMQMNVQQVADFIRSELALQHHSDKQIANELKKIHLTEKLTQKTITDLEAQGAGPKTVKELERLRTETASLKPPSHAATYSPATVPDNVAAIGSGTMGISVKAAPIPPPDSVRRAKILDSIKQYAMSYNQSLPNFICVRVTRQYVSLYPNIDRYRDVGTILAQVGYHDGQEENKIYSVNGKLVNMGVNQAPNSGGAFSTGEFADLMRSIFDPSSQAEFGWDHWGTLRGQRMAVFNYFIDSGHSSFSITYDGGAPDAQRIITAYKGLVYADQDTGAISRITFIAVDIPASFPVKQAVDILDYGEQEISGNTYICPLRAELRMRARGQKSRNDIEFRDYRKFETGFSIQYGSAAAPPPLPKSQTQEQPASASKAPAQPAKQTSDPLVLPTAPPPKFDQ
ncbi:MAG: hypothetical protein ACRD4O_02540 [Bryobacteraceae bacterium]